MVLSSSNEQFSFQPNPRKKRRCTTLNAGSPFIILILEIIVSWWAAYTSLVGMVAAAVMGLACALILFVGSPHNNTDRFGHQDLLFSETPPPPPLPTHADRDIWRDDDDSADTSIGGRQAFNTPLMRRSILADEDDEEEPLGSRSFLRKRIKETNYSSTKTPGLKGRVISVNPNKIKEPFSASRVLARVVGILLALLLTLIPASGCKPMRVVFREDDSNDFFECAGGCIPLSRTRVARKHEGMREGRCDSIGYRCWHQAGTMVLHNFEVDVGVYVVPSLNGSCGDSIDDENGEAYKNNDDANVAASGAANGEIEGAQ